MQDLLADIYVVGLGMFELRHVTAETLEVLKRARSVYHVSGRHGGLRAINPNTHHLGKIYSRRRKRTYIYHWMAEFVVNSASEGTPVVFAADGNPMFFNDVSWNIAAIAKKRHLRVEALPGVSCLDVLPMQLGFEPADLGLQIFDATQLVLYDLPINAHLSTLLLQVGFFFVTTTRLPPRRRPGAFVPLVQHLRKFFPKDHPVVFIESASSRKRPTAVFSTELRFIDNQRNNITPGMTLYVPRAGVPRFDTNLWESLDLR